MLSDFKYTTFKGYIVLIGKSLEHRNIIRGNQIAALKKS